MKSGPLPLDQLRLMSDIFGQIKREYVEPVDDKKLLTGNAQAAWSPASTRTRPTWTRRTSRNCGKARVPLCRPGDREISQEEGLVKVINPIEDTPAFRAGIQPGDLITRIDDKPVRGLPLEQAVKRMRGEHGTKGDADDLPQERGTHVPGLDHARGGSACSRSRPPDAGQQQQSAESASRDEASRSARWPT